MAFQDLPVQYTLTITATRPGTDTFILQEPVRFTVITVTGDFDTVNETLGRLDLDSSALFQLQRFNTALTTAPDDAS